MSLEQKRQNVIQLIKVTKGIQLFGLLYQLGLQNPLFIERERERERQTK